MNTSMNETITMPVEPQMKYRVEFNNPSRTIVLTNNPETSPAIAELKKKYKCTIKENVQPKEHDKQEYETGQVLYDTNEANKLNAEWQKKLKEIKEADKTMFDELDMMDIY